MHWGWEFWQGTLHPSNNLDYANSYWFRLIKQYSVNMIDTYLVGRKFVRRVLQAIAHLLKMHYFLRGVTWPLTPPRKNSFTLGGHLRYRKKIHLTEIWFRKLSAAVFFLTNYAKKINHMA